MNPYIIILTFFVSHFICKGQDNGYNIDSLLVNALYNRVEIPTDLFASNKYGELLLNKIAEYHNDKNPKTRLKAYSLTLEVANKNTDRQTKMRAMEDFLKSSYDPNYANREYLSGMYKYFPKDIYSQNFISSLERLLHDSKNVNRSHILLAGVLGLEREFIRGNFLQEEKEFKNEFGLSHKNSIYFSAHLALARMGEESSIDYVLRKAKENNPDDIVSKWLERIAYIKQPKAIDFIFEYLYSDETFRPDPESGVGYSYAAKAINVLKDVIIGFPELKLYYPPDDDIETARQWVRAHRNNYKINRDVW